MATPQPEPDLAPLIDAHAEARAEAERVARIAAQNDAFRRSIVPGAAPCPLPGRLVLTRSVIEHGDAFARAAIETVAADVIFTEDNDPWGDHTFGAVVVEGIKVWWKLDLYDADYRFGSERPDDPEATARVLTILLPEDW